MIDTSFLTRFGRAALVIVVGVLVARLVGAALGRVLSPHFSAQSAMIARRLTTWTLYVLAMLGALHQLGVDPSVLWGAAGILTVAFGFASQTSASNIISGLFLIAERPFVVGDVITIETVTGEVVSIDLMSVKLRTFDNLFVRVPNEIVVKSRMTNNTHFPLRRYDLQISVDYDSDIERVREVLLDVADKNPRCFAEPAPAIIFQGYGESSINLQFSVWTATANYLVLRNSISEEVKLAFDAAGIVIPFPQRVLSQRQPLAVRVVGEEP